MSRYVLETSSFYFDPAKHLHRRTSATSGNETAVSVSVSSDYSFPFHLITSSTWASGVRQEWTLQGNEQDQLQRVNIPENEVLICCWRTEADTSMHFSKPRFEAVEELVNEPSEGDDDETDENGTAGGGGTVLLII